MSRSIVFALALALASVAAGAHAEDPTIRLDVRTLDLNNPADARQAYAMVSKAAQKVCHYEREVFTADEVERFDICYRDAMADVVAQSKSPLLAQLNGQPAPTVRLAGR